MTSWTARQRAADVTWQHDRMLALQVPCDESGCGAGVDELCRNLRTGCPARASGGASAADRRREGRGAGRRDGWRRRGKETAVTRVEWDAIWQRVHDAARRRGVGPNKAVHLADGHMSRNNFGDRPAKETTR